jgi:hypothetical protein
MKVAITGHTKGLGKALKDCFEANGHEVVGFSRSNGYDIADSLVRARITAELSDYDVFINNAWVADAQQLMLAEACIVFANTNKVIINISSTMIYVDEALLQLHAEYMMQYQKDKIEGQKLATKDLMEPNPNIMNIVSGFIDTDLAKDFNGVKMDAKDVAELIYYMYDNRHKVMVRDITISPFVNFSTGE